MYGQIVCSITDASEVGLARRQAVLLAQNAGFDETEAGRVALVATELANNLVRHAGRGQLMMQVIKTCAKSALLEVLSIDSGPGMDVEQCMRDGYSSAGTSGTGLGAVRRLSTEFDVYSRAGNGCIVMSRISNSTESAAQMSGPWRYGVICTPAPGETAIGDTWRLVKQGDCMGVLVADGLGHGPLAAEASNAAANVFEESSPGSLAAFFARAHPVLRSTRGAAVATALCPANESELSYCSVGNVTASILSRSGIQTRLMSHNGTVGAEMRTASTLMYKWASGDRLVVHSDGLTTRWSFKDYPDLMQYHPSIGCAVLYRDHLRGRDDATILVLERVA